MFCRVIGHSVCVHARAYVCVCLFIHVYALFPCMLVSSVFRFDVLCCLCVCVRVCACVLVCVFACAVRLCVRQRELRELRQSTRQSTEISTLAESQSAEISELKKQLQKGYSVNQSLAVCLSVCLPVCLPSLSGFARYLSRIVGHHSSEPATMYTRERTHPHRHASVHTECPY